MVACMIDRHFIPDIFGSLDYCNKHVLRYYVIIVSVASIEF